jgi:hypothetical protein
MKEKIKKLFKEYYNDETMPVIELEDQVLALFSVVEQREQLKDFASHLSNEWNCPDINDDIIDAYLESLEQTKTP